MKKTIAIIASLLAVLPAMAIRILPPDARYQVRLGYNIGGTAPIGLPAEIRSLNRYKIQSNFLLGFDVSHTLAGPWGVMSGLRFESKGMEIDATVKNYHMEIVQGGSRLEGYFTGHDVTQVELQMITLPVELTWAASPKLSLRMGPYVSYLTTRNFNGNVYDGWLRVGNPTGRKVIVGDTEETRATYDFSDSMRHWQYGIDLGADWNIYHRWGVYASLSWGLNGIFKSGFNTIEQTLYPIYGSFGVTYQLK